MSERLAVIIPVYNESEIIKTVLTDWSKTLDELSIDYKIFAFNDGSSDNSLQMMKEASNQHPRIDIIDKPNSGHGPTILQGYKNATNGFDWIFQIDSDNEMPSIYFKVLWKNRNENDFLIGYRFGRQPNLARKLLTYFSRLTVTFFFGDKILDVNSPFRLMRTSFFREYFSKLSPGTFAPNVIISGIAARKDARVFSTDVPYTFRQTGKVSIGQLKLVLIAWKCFIQTLRSRKI